jgi:carbon-monoxide dehydrogenase medium subunit
MKPPPFSYYDPTELGEALDLLARLDNARVLAGGQSLMPMLNMRFVQPDHLIDLNPIGELAGITFDEPTLSIGAMTRQRALENDAFVRARLPLITEALAHVGHMPTRNRGTVGGSLCHMDPAAELVAVAMALDGEIEVRGRQGSRMLPISDFAAGYMSPAIDSGEIVTKLRLALPPAGSGQCFLEFARRHGDFALASVAVVVAIDDEGRVATVAAAVGAVAATPVRLTEAEEALVGATPDVNRFASAARICSTIDAMDDPQVPAWYRRQVSEALLVRALGIASSRARMNGRVGAH